MEALTFSTLELAAPADGEADLSAPFAVLYADTFKRPDFPKDGLKVTEADLDNAVKVFNEIYVQLGGIPLDDDHAFAEGRDAQAVGWVKQLWRDGQQLMARVAWTDLGKGLISSGRKRLFSPEFTNSFEDETGKKWGFALISGALTNRPFLRKGLAPVAMSESAREVVAAEASALTALTVNGTSLTAAPKDARDMTEPTVTAKQVEDLTETLNEVRATVETLKADNATLSERADAAEATATAAAKELAEERLSAVLSQARREGRIDAKDETTTEFSELHEKVGLDGVKTILAKIPAETIPVSEQGHGRDLPITASDAPEGVDPDSYALHLRAEAIAAEQDIPYEQAASLAFQEVQA